MSTDLALRPDDAQLERLAHAADITDLAGYDVDTLADQARWHKEQADHHQQRALFHWLECGRHLLAIRAISERDGGVRADGWETFVRSELALNPDTARKMVYLAKNREYIPETALTQGTTVGAVVSEVARRVQIEKHAKPREAIPWIAQMPPHMEVEEGLAEALPLNDELVDLIVTSPPYNLGLSYGPGIDDDRGYPEYLEYVESWAREMYRVAGPHGRLALNVPLDTMRGGTPRPIYADWYYALKEAGWVYRTTILWDEGNVTRSVARGSIGRPSSPYVAAPVEMILIAHKGDWKIERSGVTPDLTKEESLAWQGPAGGVWSFNGATHGRRPGTFPEEMPYRLIKLLSYPGDIVLDPFLGSGTTAVVAYRLGRTCYGFDKDPHAVSEARQRIDGEARRGAA